MKFRRLWAATICGAFLCASLPVAHSATWHFDFTSPARGGGFFEIDAASFVIPVSAGSPTSFNVTAADITIDAGSFLGTQHFVATDAFNPSCTPGECAVSFHKTNVVFPGIGTYTINLQLNFAQIWQLWTDQQIQMWLYTTPYAQSLAWNDVASAERTVLAETPLPAALPLFATGLGVLGLLGCRKRKARRLAIGV